MTAPTESKTALVVLSGPNGGEEALGRVFNALALALLKDNAVPGTSGVASLRALTQDGYTVLPFWS